MQLVRLWSERQACIAKSAWNSSPSPLQAAHWLAYGHLIAVPFAILLAIVAICDAGALFRVSGLRNIQGILYHGRSFCLAGLMLQSCFFITTAFWQWGQFVLDRADSNCEALLPKSLSRSEQVDGLVLYRLVYSAKPLLWTAPLWVSVGYLFGDIPMALCDLTACVAGVGIFGTLTLFLRKREETEQHSSTLGLSAAFVVAGVVALWGFQIAFSILYDNTVSKQFAEVSWPLAFDFSNCGTALSCLLFFGWVRARAVRSL